MNQPHVIHTLIVDENGIVHGLGNPLGLEGNSRKIRYSEIVPTNRLLLAAFRTLRWLFGEEGHVSDFTRRWRCEWRATVLHNGLTKTSDNRAELIEWEHQQFGEDHFTTACDL